ncbi:uncharacterized protein TNCV_2829191 [Trichonephila clavipes]|nr:uncharacterized protein TNCV_2829191 [Trichonephila clavipes]
MERKDIALFQKCLYHTLSEAMKSSVLVRNFAPFRHWTTIIIDRVDNSSCQLRTETCGRNTGITATDRFLMPTFLDVMTNKLLLFLNRRINTNIPCNIMETSSVKRYLNPLHESTWRRLYDSNTTFFFYDYKDFILYIKEQTLESKPVNVFKEIMERQIGKTFNTTAVLKRIASPYYYVLPHQDEQEYSSFQTKVNRHYYFGRRSSDYMAYRFYCDLKLVRAAFLFNVAR